MDFWPIFGFLDPIILIIVAHVQFPKASTCKMQKFPYFPFLPIYIFGYGTTLKPKAPEASSIECPGMHIPGLILSVDCIF